MREGLHGPVDLRRSRRELSPAQRLSHGPREFLDELLTDTIATLPHQQIVTLQTVAQDGLRVRSHAGSGSFRRQKSLEKCRQEAAEQVQRLRAESDDDSASGHDASTASGQK